MSDNRNPPQQQRRTAALVPVRPAELGVPERPLTDAPALADAINALAERYREINLLAPISRPDYLPPHYAVALRIVKFDATFTAADADARSNGTYYKTDGGKLALHRSALDLLASAAGISSVPGGTKVERVGRWRWRATVTIELRATDGRLRRITRSKEVDLTDETAAATGVSEKQLRQARAHGAQLAESKAYNRCVRAALGLRGAYTPAEAARPFVFPVMIFAPDTSDPEVKRMILAAELGIAGQVYGGRSDGAAPPALEQQQPGRDVIDHDDDPGDDLDEHDDPTGDDEPPLPSPRPAPVKDRRDSATAPAEWLDDGPPDDVDLPTGSAGSAGSSARCSADGCGVELDAAVRDYSTRRHGRPLCRDHQRGASRPGGGR